ncbi:helix-turn-helix domain-containing protein [Mesorhizobium sp. B2-3-12]|uniref:helix-turn-helix domain-containing protein n=1 Tax=Mesorhizobium sp. B2-3-12 TaxID=2589952 RepID=UPI00112D3339|nr:helix-turn-helix domain-containing protein [Mesorhizobium sp. B2-3-12]TPL81890.1 helix-turn-helix domain-containing protein [Mesorhizobium sp. B2-3-12]
MDEDGEADARAISEPANSSADIQETEPRSSTVWMTCECVFCANERRRQGFDPEPETAEQSRTPDREAMDRYRSRLLPGSLGENRDWSILMAGRRFVGGKPIDFKDIVQRVYRGKARRALYSNFGATQASLDGASHVDALDDGMDNFGSVGNEWLTITAYGQSKGMGGRRARDVMSSLHLLQPEIEVRSAPCIVDPAESEGGWLNKSSEDWLGATKPDYRTTERLATWALQAGFGRRMKSRAGIEFDVLSPDGVAWLDARWPKSVEKLKAKRGRPSTLREEVRRLLDEGKTQAEIARLLGKSRQIVSHHFKALVAS